MAQRSRDPGVPAFDFPANLSRKSNGMQCRTHAGVGSTKRLWNVFHNLSPITPMRALALPLRTDKMSNRSHHTHARVGLTQCNDLPSLNLCANRNPLHALIKIELEFDFH